MGKQVVVVGFPRSGTNFLHRLLAHCIDGPERPVWDGKGEHSHVSKIHWEYQVEDLGLQGVPVIHIIRDPRATALSGYFCYLKFYGGARGHTRDSFSFLEFLADCFSDGWDLWPCGWKEHTERWITRSTVSTASYEWLLRGPEAYLTSVSERLEGISPGGIRHAVAQSRKFDAERPSYADPAKTVPAGCPEWGPFFGVRERIFMQSYCGSLMNSLGYHW